MLSRPKLSKYHVEAVGACRSGSILGELRLCQCDLVLASLIVSISATVLAYLLLLAVAAPRWSRRYLVSCIRSALSALWCIQALNAQRMLVLPRCHTLWLECLILC